MNSHFYLSVIKYFCVSLCAALGKGIQTSRGERTAQSLWQEGFALESILKVLYKH